MNDTLYKLLIKLSEWCFNEKIKAPPSLNDPVESIKAPVIPMDYKILIVAPDTSSAALYANSLLLEPENWTFVDSVSDVDYYVPGKCEIHAVGNWYKNPRCQNLINWASKHHYKVV